MRWGIFLILMLPFALSPADEGGRGVYGSTPLSIPLGVRSAGMGDAFVGVADDLSALSFNPAGLSRMTSPRLTASHYEWFGDVRCEWLGFAQPIGGILTAAVSILYLHTPQTPMTVESSAGAWGYVQDGSFKYSATSFQIGVGAEVGLNLMAGAAVRISEGSLSFQNTSSPMPKYAGRLSSLCLGLLYETPIPRLRVGLSISGMRLSGRDFLGEEMEIPRLISLGIGYELRFRSRGIKSGEAPENALILSADLLIPSDDRPTVRVGGEYRMANGLAVRIGYRSDGDLEGLQRLSGGIGYSSANYTLDYAFTPYGDLGDVHRAALTIRF